MRTSFHAGWQLPMLALLLVVLSMPIWADTLPTETELNKIKLNSMFSDVLTNKGAPTFIGPSVENADGLMALLEAPPATAMSAMLGMFGGPMPGRPRMIPGAPTPTTPDTTTKPPENYMVWLYEKHDAQFRWWNTYVFFNERGVVVGVVVIAESPNVTTPVQTESHVKIGTPLMDIVGNYDWPDPFTTVGSDYYCNYPANNVTYGLDQRSHRVISIAVGLPFVAESHTATAK